MRLKQFFSPAEMSVAPGENVKMDHDCRPFPCIWTVANALHNVYGSYIAQWTNTMEEIIPNMAVPWIVDEINLFAAIGAFVLQQQHPTIELRMSYDVCIMNTDNGQIVTSRLILIILRFPLDGIWKVSHVNHIPFIRCVSAWMWRAPEFVLQSATPASEMKLHGTSKPNSRSESCAAQKSYAFHGWHSVLPVLVHDVNFDVTPIESKCISKFFMHSLSDRVELLLSAQHNGQREFSLRIFKADNKFAVDSNLYTITLSPSSTATENLKRCTLRLPTSQTGDINRFAGVHSKMINVTHVTGLWLCRFNVWIVFDLANGKLRNLPNAPTCSVYDLEEIFGENLMRSNLMEWEMENKQRHMPGNKNFCFIVLPMSTIAITYDTCNVQRCGSTEWTSNHTQS